jgi:hypothetical protein|tara:strand:+ start:945 stop:1559 length:615 start_codon:yes stop_codon:yes gene_type:complete
MSNVGIKDTQRVSLKPKPGNKEWDWTGMLEPLKHNKGVIFPYTPTISMGQNTNYGSYDPVHTNYQPNYWINTPNPTISVTTTFANQTQADAKYNAASIHFFKSCMKGHFGENDSNPGLPPPILMFSGYGGLHAKSVPVLVSSFQYTMQESDDYITVVLNGEEHSMPITFMGTLELVVQQNPQKVKNEWSHSEYRNGNLLNGGFI